MKETVSDLNLIFATPVWTSIINNHSEINRKILQYIEKLQKEDPKGKQVSNINGWHSNDFKLEDEVIKFFISSISQNIKKAIDDMGWDADKSHTKITNMWTIVNTKGSSNARHIHNNCYLSSAYYVKAPENCGDILFYDPRSAKVIRKPRTVGPTKLNAEEVNITPQEGMLVLFPSYLHHAVAENISEKERVVVSFNVDLR